MKQCNNSRPISCILQIVQLKTMVSPRYCVNFFTLLSSDDGDNGHFQIRFQILLCRCRNTPRFDFSKMFQADRTGGIMIHV